ncbi:uncharacterized protein LOC127714502 isoform X3 [Mytilus californianus]|uniref:uncharacterized protein LOC127714502 isoform X3 n=1 Tax=Mytilus californianus TaxID=6549 RepID=UPI00224718B4|nr:uncharacterized protein LOC127714502 isoform X3 [Mytilus californianus]
MEWILLKSMFIIFTTVKVRGLPTGPGVCKTPQRIKHKNKTVKARHCCNNFYQIDERCVECPIGHFSKGDNCTKCVDERYGSKCAEQCRCNSNERCDNVKGCILVDAVDGRTTYKTVTGLNAGGQTAGNGSSNVVIFMACVAVGGILIVICGTILAKNREAVCRRKPTTIAMENAIRKRKGQTLSFEEENVKEKKESMFAHINEKYMINFDGE